MSTNKDTVRRYLDGFRTANSEQILSCLTEDIEWTVFGWFHITGKPAYASHILEEGFVGSPELTIVRLVEEDGVVMAELTGVAHRADGTVMRLSMAEVFVLRDGRIAERRAWVIELKNGDWT
jgi:ketosteroid isomerase-like protein